MNILYTRRFNMNNQQYIKLFLTKLARCKGVTNGQYTIDSIYRYDNTSNLKIKIQDCIAVIEKWKSHNNYINSLKMGDSVEVKKYTRKEKITIKRITYLKKLYGVDISSKKIISKIIDNEGCDYKPKDIQYKNVDGFEFEQAYLHSKPNGYMFLDKWDIKNIERIANI